MKKRVVFVSAIALIFVCVVAAYRELRPIIQGIKPAIETVPLPAALPQSALGEELPDGFLQVADGYHLRLLTRDVINPRVMIFDQRGRLIISEPSASRVSVIEEGKRRTLLEKLDKPHGLALDGQYIYVAQTGKIVRYSYDNTTGSATNPTSILDLPSGGRHWTRTIGIGPDQKLYISIGSSCNICVETDWRRTKILRYDLVAQKLETMASGLRNAVFFTWQPETKAMFATEMGRDWLGNDLPPDELDQIEFGADYGFPYCYGQNKVDPELNQPDKCVNAKPPLFEFGAHEAPLGLAFYQNDLWVALHGSWNRTPAIGYEVIRLRADSQFQKRESMISGWLLKNGKSSGRPAGLTVGPDNRLYIADDSGDAIYVLSTN